MESYTGEREKKRMGFIKLTLDGEQKELYQLVQTYLQKHFTNLPQTSLEYGDAGGKLVIVFIKGSTLGDAIGLDYKNGVLTLDEVSTDAIPELKILYGYEE